MSNTIKLKRGSGSDPSASDLSVGELAIRTDNGKIFTKKDNGSVAEISGGGGGIDDGDKGDITVSNGGDTFTIDSGVISTAKIADEAVTLAKLEHGTVNNNGKFLRANNGADPTFETISQYNQSSVFSLFDQASTPVQRVLVGTEGMTIQGTSSAVSKLMFRDRTTANFLKFKPVDTLSAGVEFTLPSADGSANHVLKTDGSGVMSFGTIVDASVASDAAIALSKLATGTLPSGLKVNHNNLQTGIIENENISSSAAIAGSKISPDFGSQNISTTGTFSSGAITASSTGNASLILDAGTGSASGNQISFIDLKINGTVKGNIAINEGVSGTPLELNSASGTGAVQLFDSGTKKFETSSDGATITGRLTPAANNTYGLGTSSLRFANFFAVDGNFSGTITGNVTGNVTGNASGSSGSCTGNAATATKLASAITIAGVSFDGSANISLNNNAITNGAGYITSADGGNAATLDSLDSTQFLRSDASDTMTGTLTIGDGSAQTELHIKKADNNVSDHLQFYNGTTRVGEIGCEDSTWLRINQETAKNIYTPRYIRADNGFFVDGTSKGINGSGNFIGGTIAGASDYSTLLRSNANDTASGQITFSSGISTDGEDVYLSNGTLISNDSGGAFSDRSGSNIDHIWHNDSNNSWNFVSDSTYKGTANSQVRAGSFYGDGSNLTGISAGGATGGGSDEVFYENDQTVTTSYTITNGKNAMAAGPITINSGVTVTVGSGETLTIV